MKSRDKPIRVDLDFEEELRKIKIERLTKGKDRMPKSDRRLTKAIRRHPLWNNIREDIIKADLLEDMP